MFYKQNSLNSLERKIYRIVISTYVWANVKYNMCTEDIDLIMLLCKCHVFFEYELGSFFAHLYKSQSHVKKIIIEHCA